MSLALSFGILRFRCHILLCSVCLNDVWWFVLYGLFTSTAQWRICYYGTSFSKTSPIPYKLVLWSQSGYSSSNLILEVSCSGVLSHFAVISWYFCVCVQPSLLTGKPAGFLPCFSALLPFHFTGGEGTRRELPFPVAFCWVSLKLTSSCSSSPLQLLHFINFPFVQKLSLSPQKRLR